MAEWSWDPDDFAVLWYSEANDRFPHPLRYTSRLASNDEVAAHRAAVRGRYDVEEIERIELALHTLTASDLRIEIGGESTVLGKGKSREYRVLGARTDFHAVMLTQTAGEGVDGPVRCRLFPVDQLAGRVAAILPSVPPGNAAPDTFHVRDLQSNTVGATRNSPRERFERLTRGPFDGSAAAGLFAGYLHNRPDPWYTLGWFDAAGDGRYLQQQTREHLTVRPVAAQDLTRHFDTWIERARQRLRADELDVW